MSAFLQKQTYGELVLSETQINVMDEIITDLVKNLYQLNDKTIIFNTKMKLLRAIITKNMEEKTPELSLVLLAPPQAPERDILYNIIDESLKEAQAMVPACGGIEITNEIRISNSNKILNVDLRVAIIDSPKITQILEFIKLIKTFFASNETLDTNISNDRINLLCENNRIHQIVLPHQFNWRRASVRNGMDNFIKSHGRKNSEERNPDICSMDQTFKSLELSITVCGKVGQFIIIIEQTKSIRIRHLKQNMSYTIKGKTFTTDSFGALEIPIELFE